MSPFLLAVLVWAIIRAVRSARRSKGSGPRARFSAHPAPLPTAYPRTALVLVGSVCGVIVAAGAAESAAIETVDGLLLLAGLVALGLRLVPRPMPRLRWAANIALAVVVGDFLGAVLADLARHPR